MNYCGRGINALKLAIYLFWLQWSGMSVIGFFRLFRLNRVKLFSIMRENILNILVYALHDCYI